MDLSRMKHCLTVLRSDLGRESIELLRYELQQIIDSHGAEIEKYGQYLTSTKDEDLAKLKLAAVLNKARKEAAEHLQAFLNEEYIDEAIKSISVKIKEGQTNA